jgi:RNA polymerase sigma factor (sigma-70 family)
MPDTAANAGINTWATSDGELLADYLASGSQRSFEQLVRRHAVMVLGVCRGILRDASDAEDAAQAAFITLARRAGSLRNRRTIAGWLHTVAWHVATRAREARQLRQRREREAAAAFAAAALGARQEEGSAAAALAIVHEEIRALPEKYRVPLVLHHLEGWSEQEVAAMLASKLGTISGQLGRARAMLKQRLQSRGVEGLAVAGGLVRALEDVASSGQPGADAFVSSVSRAAVGPSAVASAHAEALARGAVRMIRRASLRAMFTSVALVVVVVAVATITMVQWWPAAQAALRNESAPSGAVRQLTATRSARLHGTVVDPDHRAAPGVTVRLYRSRDDATAGRRAISRTTTGDDGSFTFEGAPADHTYFLLCFMQGPAPMHGEADVPVARETSDVDCGTVVLKAGRY